jgi:hypothetical protein
MEELVERLVRWNLHPADMITHRFPLEKVLLGEGGRLEFNPSPDPHPRIVCPIATGSQMDAI